LGDILAVITYKEAKSVANFAWDKSGRPNQERARIVDKAVSKVVWSHKIYGSTVEDTQKICKNTIFRLGNEWSAMLNMPEKPIPRAVLFAPVDPEIENFIAGVEDVIADKAIASRDNADKILGKKASALSP